MPRIAPWLLVLFSLVAVLGCSRGPSTLAKPNFKDNVEYKEDPQAKEIRAFYQRFKDAVVQQDADAVLKLSDGSTLRWFQTALDTASSRKKGDLEKLDLQSQMFVLFLRYKRNEKQLKEMDAKRVLQEIYLSKEWLGKFEQIDVGLVNVKDDRTVTATSTVQPNQVVMEFGKENGEWKYRFEASHLLLGKTVKEVAQQQMRSDREILMDLLHQIRVFPNESIFDGPIEGK